LIYSRLLSNIGNKDDNNDCALGFRKVDDNNKTWNKEEAEDMSGTRPYSCIMCTVNDDNDKGSTEDNKEESNKAGEMATGNEEACIRVVNSCVISLDNCEGVDYSAGAGGMFGSGLLCTIVYATCRNPSFTL